MSEVDEPTARKALLEQAREQRDFIEHQHDITLAFAVGLITAFVLLAIVEGLRSVRAVVADE